MVVILFDNKYVFHFCYYQQYFIEAVYYVGDIIKADIFEAVFHDMNVAEAVV